MVWSSERSDNFLGRGLIYNTAPEICSLAGAPPSNFRNTPRIRDVLRDFRPPWIGGTPGEAHAGSSGGAGAESSSTKKRRPRGKCWAELLELPGSGTWIHLATMRGVGNDQGSM